MTREHQITFLHTGQVHVESFAALMKRIAPQMAVRHIVDEPLLNETVEQGGMTEPLRERLREHLQSAVAGGADIVVCTCSTLGGEAEAVGQNFPPPVLRIDRAMAEKAVESGERILVLACIDSTLKPTTDLLRQVANQKGRAPTIEVEVIEGAWPQFLAGDLAGYHATIERALRAAAERAQVLVLAQASMAPAAERCADLAVPILSSPELGVCRAVESGTAS